MGNGREPENMKVSIFENPAVTEDHAEIHCQSATDEILWAAGLLENTGTRLVRE